MAEYKGKNNLIGQHFNKLTVLEYSGDSKWKCQCDCGNIVQVRTASLTTGKTKSCGCLRGQNLKNNTRNYKPKEDLTNKKFGKLTPLYYIKGGKWHCLCDCGNECDVDTRNLNSNHSLSCGCLCSEVNKRKVVDMTNFENDSIKVLERAGSDNQHVALWKCLCKKCGNTFITRGSSIRNGDTRSCGCVHSWNEQLITKMLLSNNIEFATQYTFKDLKGINGGALRFDFAIFKNGVLSHLIEYNGMQHYIKSNTKWGGDFEERCQNDKLKIQYCKDNNIKLKIIKYDEEYSLEDLILEPVETIP